MTRHGEDIGHEMNMEIQSLRAVAILMAIYSHCGSLFFWKSPNYAASLNYIQSWVGLDLFFCISGFVICSSIIRNFPRGGSQEKAIFVVQFWIKRFWRIMPAAWFWLFITVSLSAVYNSSGAFSTFKNNISDAIAIVLQVANFHFFSCRALGSDCGVNEAYWSLAIEEQFYLLIPLMFCILSRRTIITIMVIAAVIQIPIFYRATWTWSGMIRTDGLAIGCLIAFARHSWLARFIEPRFLNTPFKAFAWCAVTLVLLNIVCSPALKIVPFYTGMAVVLSGVLVWTASYNKGFLFSPTKIRRVLEHIGSRSYAMYLIHIPVFLFINETMVRFYPAGTVFNDRYAFSVISIAVILIIILSEFSYRVIEAPLRLRGIQLARRIRPATGV